MIDTIWIILICVSAALAIFEVGRRCGKEESCTRQVVGNVRNSTVNQSGRDIKRKNIVVTAYAVFPHATSPMTREHQLEAAKEELAKDLGKQCWLNGCVAFDYGEKDLEYPPGVYKDRVFASISVEKLED